MLLIAPTWWLEKTESIDWPYMMTRKDWINKAMSQEQEWLCPARTQRIKNGFVTGSNRTHRPGQCCPARQCVESRGYHWLRSTVTWPVQMKRRQVLLQCWFVQCSVMTVFTEAVTIRTHLCVVRRDENASKVIQTDHTTEKLKTCWDLLSLTTKDVSSNNLLLWRLRQVQGKLRIEIGACISLAGCIAEHSAWRSAIMLVEVGEWDMINGEWVSVE